jgi:hypothetical protein
MFEAGGRPGGRILTVDKAGQLADDGFDLGPIWFWPQMQPAIGNLVAKLDLPVFTQHTEGDAFFEQSLHEAAQRLRGLQREPPSMRLAGGAASLVAGPKTAW